jgi:hypothetical protein
MWKQHQIVSLVALYLFPSFPNENPSNYEVDIVDWATYFQNFLQLQVAEDAKSTSAKLHVVKENLEHGIFSGVLLLILCGVL